VFEWVARVVSSLAGWAFWTGSENGPAVGRTARRSWRQLAFLGRVQFLVAVALLVALVLGWAYAT
jgi:hypothetical protein